MKANDFAKVSELMRRLKDLSGDVNGADVVISFTDGTTATLPMDKNLGRGYLVNERSLLTAQLAKLGVEIEA